MIAYGFKPEVLWEGKVGDHRARFVQVSRDRIVAEQGDKDAMGQMSWKSVDRLDRVNDGLCDLSPVTSSAIFEALLDLWSKVPRTPKT